MNNLDPAWIGLIGVVVGAVIVGTLQYLGVLRKERSDQTREKRAENVAIQRAARSIDADLMIVEHAVQMCFNEGRWWLFDLHFTLEGWNDFREVIVSRLSWDEWITVMASVQAVRDLQSSRDGNRRIQLAELETDPKTKDVLAAGLALGLDTAHPGPEITEEQIALLEPMLDGVRAGREVLASLARGNL